MEIASGVWPGGFEHGESDLPERQHLTVPEGGKGVVSLRPCPQANGRPGTFVQFQMPSKKIGVEVRQEHKANVPSVGFSIRQILVDVPLRVDHYGSASHLVGNEVRGVCQASEIILLQ
jgi:hypothetical protein